jgi:hypothetical protein
MRVAAPEKGRQVWTTLQLGPLRFAKGMVPAGPIETALLELPILPATLHLVPRWVSMLQLILSRDAATVLAAHRAGRQGAHELGTPKTAASELRRVAAALDELQGSLDALGVAALEAVPAKVFARLRDARGLLGGAALPAAVRHAAVTLEAEAGGSGRPADVASSEVATCAGWAFFELTGKKPPRRGEFVGLVAAIFAAGGIEASPETYAALASRAIKEQAVEPFGRGARK